MPNQLKSIAAADAYCQAAKQYLQLVPIACLNAETMYLDAVKRTQSPDGSRLESPPPAMPTSSSPTPSLTSDRLSTAVPTITGPPVSTNPFDLPPGRPRSGSNSSCSSHTSLSSVPPSSTAPASQDHSSEAQRLVFEYVPLEVAYFADMEGAHAAIESCAARSRCWSSCYDRCSGPAAEGTQGTAQRGDHDSGDHDNGAVFRSRSATMSLTAGRVRNENRLYPTSDGSLNYGDTGGTLGRTGSISRSSGVSPIRTRKLAELKFEEDKAGPFLKVLFEKLLNMLGQPPAVNLLLTRLVARLAHYPQPLLRSFLLNHQLVLVSGVPNLFAVSLSNVC